MKEITDDGKFKIGDIVLLPNNMDKIDSPWNNAKAKIEMIVDMLEPFTLKTKELVLVCLLNDKYKYTRPLPLDKIEYDKVIVINND